MALAENDRVSTIGDGGKKLKLYPIRVLGRYVKARTLVGWALFALLLIGPWIDVGGHPGIRLDIPARRFYLFGATLFASDASYLLFLFGIIVFGVFLFTALLGRVWCGWACPQTVFLEGIIRPIEELIEGKPSQRKKLDAAPWTLGKIHKKGLKLTAFAVVAGGIATTSVAYFIGREGILEAQADPFSHPTATLFFLGISAALMFDFTWFREQTCIVVCPYGRFQSVLLDADSLVVGYDTNRGEPRGRPAKAKREAAETPLGDCIDCKRCVQVCPTGIDIRNGVQMECIHCASCIDACDEIMDNIGKPRGLVRYASEHSLAGQGLRLVRGRVVAYSVGLAVVIGALTWTASNREPVELHITRQVGAPYIKLDSGDIQNNMTMRISNRDGETRVFGIELVSPEDAKLITPLPRITVKAGATERVPLFLMRPSANIGGVTSEFRVRVRDEQGFEKVIGSTFIAPEPGNGGGS